MRRLQFYKNEKKEKGAITLFVLLACLFFVFILTGVYLSLLNRAQVQEQEVQQIKDNYAKDIERVDEIYENLAKSAIVTLRQEPANGVWTDEVTLIGNAKLDEESTAIIVNYIFNQESIENNQASWSWQAVSGTNIKELVNVKQEGITENGKYYFWIKDSEGEIFRSNELEVTNIDKNEPTAGTIIATEQNEDGTEKEYDLQKSPWTDKSVKIEKVDGTDGEGETETVYTIKKDGVEYENSIANPRTEPTILTETGEYTVTVITTDKVGNTAKREYIIKIDKVVPILALKHNDANGADYEQGIWTKDDLYGEITLDNRTGKEVEKYQYSENGVIWNDITGEIKQPNIEYTTTFPMSGDKPEWISGPVNNGEYYFEIQSDGTLKPNNGGKNSTTAHSYFEIDLTNQPNATVEITINATISSQIWADYGYATITTSSEAPAYNDSEGRFIYEAGSTSTSDYTTTITGGHKYYLHIGYRKDFLTAMFKDAFIINRITLKAENLAVDDINFYNYNKNGNTVTFDFQEEMEKEIYIRAIYTDSKTTKYGDKTSIKIDKVAPVIERANPVLLTRDEAKADIKATDERSGLKGYYISTSQTTPTENSTWVLQTTNEFTIENLNANTTYYLWIIDNVGNISKRQEIIVGIANYIVDDKTTTETLEEAISIASDGSIIKLLGDYKDTSTAIFSKNVTFDVQSYTLTRNSIITIDSGKAVEITGTGKITSGTSNISTITNNGTFTISNRVTLENNSTSTSYAPIYNNSSSAITNVNDNTQILGYYRGIYNNYGTININGGKIEAIYSNSSSYGIYNYSRTSVRLNMNAGEVKGYYGIYNGNSSSMEMTGGKVIGVGAEGIYAHGTTNIYGGRVEGKTYGICGYATNKVTIGRETEELNITTPAIYGGNYGIYMNNTSYGFNFYNGVIISNTKETAYRGVLNPRTNHMTYTYFDYDVEQKYCTVLTPVVEKITMEATPTEFTNRDVTVKITYPNNTDTRQYSEDKTTWQETEDYVQEVIVTENKIIYARTINAAGVITDEEQIEITNIDKEIPTVSVSPSQTNYIVSSSNETVDLKLTLTANDTGVSGLDKVQYAWVEDGEEIEYTDFESIGTTITENNLKIGQYYLYFYVTDKAGNRADLQQIRYNVKLEEPVCKIGSTTYTTIQEAIEACSKDAIRIENNHLNTTVTFPLVANTLDWINGPNNNGTYYFEVQSDGTLKPNNSSIHSTTANSYFEIDLTNYTETELEITLNATISSESNCDFGYATITTDTTVPAYNSSDGQFIKVSGSTSTADYTTTLMGGQKYYLHIGYRKDVSVNSNQDTFIINSMKIEGIIQEQVIENPTTIEMLKSTDEEFSTYEGQNIILDLKGYTVGSSSVDTPLCTNNGMLQLVDTSSNKTGKLESLNGTTIENSGTFTLGDNSTSIEMDVPTIYGYKIGIDNNNIFNFYDGKIQGITPVQGSTTDTPEQYGPVSTRYDNGITTIQLGIVNDYEARIEWVYYTKLQDAINITKLYQNDYKDTVTIVKDIQLTEILEISENKDFILDLGGYTLTVAEQDRVINNNGNLEITDSSEEQTGNITIESTNVCYGIYNSNGTIEVTGGTVSSNSNNSSYGIYNANLGNVIVIKGTINSNSNYSSDNKSYGIYNASIGSIEIIGGIINSNSYRAYGIVNAENGKVNIKEGNIRSIDAKNYSSTGIYNISSGNVTITKGTIDINNAKSYSMGILNEGSGSIIMEGGTINISSNSSASGISNSGTGSVTIMGGAIINTSYTYSVYGIRNSSNGNLAITEGNIEIIGAIYGYGIENFGKLIIGNKDGFASTEEPIIKAAKHGLKNSGEVEFYDGRIEGKESSLIGDITRIEDGYIIESTLINGYKVINLVEDTNAEYIAQIGEIRYYKLQDAIDSINSFEETTINILKDFELKNCIKFSKNIELDLNGYTITNKYYSIENTGQLKIKDTSGQKGKIENIDKEIGIKNMGGRIVLEGGIISNDTNAWSSYGIYNENSGTVEVTGGTITNNAESSSYTIYNLDTGMIKITDGEIDSTGMYSCGVYNVDSGILEMTGGIININSNYNSIYYGGYGISNGEKGAVKIMGGKINSINTNGYSRGIENRGKLEIIGGEISSQGNHSYGINNNYNGIVEIEGGEISGNGSESYGINNNANLTIGVKGDGNVSQEEPYIKGGTYGIYNTEGKFYFYDGKLEGSTKAIYDIITEYEDNTELNYNENETILTLSTTLTPVAQIESTTYNTLQEAINAVGSSQTTIELLRNVAYTQNDTVITIPSNKNIILDLKGYKISSAIPGETIRNNGTLEITDTSTGQTGTIVTNEEQTITNANGANLIISGGIIDNRDNQVIYNEGFVEISGGEIAASDNGIYNNSTGSIKMTGGTITGNSNSNSRGIYNNGTGSVEMTEGTITNTRYGIYNAETGTIKVSGGTINSNYSYSNYGIYNNSTGTIIVGNKGDGIVSQSEPTILATNTYSSSYTGYGIYNPNGTLNYYDGKIQGETKAIYGNIAEVEDLTEINISSETISSSAHETLTLQQKTTNVARVNGVEYDSIEKAVKACGTSTSTITILRNSDPGATVIIENNQNITIDLNGYTINNYIELQNKGTLKITDSSSGQAGKIVGLVGIAVSNSGTMELQGGAIADSGYGIQNKGTITINGGAVSSNTYGIYNDGNGIITVESGNITSNTYGIYNYSGTTNVEGNAITGNDYGIYSAGGTTNIKEGAELQSDIGIYTAGGRVNIGETGTMNSISPIVAGETYGLSVAPTGVVYMYDGQIKGKTGATQGFITYTESGYAVANRVDGEYFVDYLALAGTVSTVAEVNGVNYSNLQSAINSIVGNEPQTIKLTNGIITTMTFTIADGQNIILDMNEKTISSDLSVTINNAGNLTIIDSTESGVGKISSTTGTAIVNSGTLRLGQDDGTVSQNLITIEGQTYGIQNTGELNFYDGTINGGSAVKGEVTNRATGYVIRTTTVNGKERYYLST